MVKLRLRTKAIIVFALLMIYLSSIGIALTNERQKLAHITLELEKAYRTEQALDRVSWTIAHSILRLQAILYKGVIIPAHTEDAMLDFQLVFSSLVALREEAPTLGAQAHNVSLDLSALREAPTMGGFLKLRDEAQRLDAQVQLINNDVETHRKALRDAYTRGNDRISLIAMTMILSGALAFGTIITIFFNRMARDIRTLERRASAIVSGYRGPQLKVTRHDEVGDLMGAINEMQVALRQRDESLELAREEQFHREKMAAIGSLAAAVAHEINNPIAAIAGIARSMSAAGKASGPDAENEDFGPEAILANIQRVAGISRQISELTAPRSPDPGLLDVNELLRQTCRFVKFDKRLQGIELALDLDSSIPAVYAVADHLSQVLLNLLLNAADALEGVDDRAPKIAVTTRACQDGVVMTVQDNGRGMDSAVLEHAFEQFFSTKPSNRARGLGLFLCKALLEAVGGRIGLESTIDVGTTATVVLLTRPVTS